MMQLTSLIGQHHLLGWSILLAAVFVATAAKRWEILNIASTVWRRWLRISLQVGIVAVLLMQQTSATYSQDKPEIPAAQQELANKQRLLAERFSKLEELFLKMSEFESSTNPARASLLQQAAKMSKELATTQKLSIASELLTKRQLSRAIEEQQASAENLRKLLELLKSENRQDRLRDERKKYEEWIKEIEKLGRLERSLRGRTENGEDLKQASKDQSEIEKQAQGISEQIAELMKEKGQPIDKQEGSKQEGSKQEGSKQEGSKQEGSKQEGSKQEGSKQEGSKQEGSKQEGSKQEGSKQEGSKQEGSKQEGSKQEGSKQEGSKQEGSKQEGSKQEGSKQEGSKQEGSKQEGSKQEGSKQEGSKQEGSKQEGSEQESSESEDGKSSDAKPKEPETPESKARSKIEQARKKMQDAIEKLNKEKRKDAVQDEGSAEKELKEAVAELEKILRQLREEEVERSLAALETRFRKMLEMQNTVLEETVRLNSLSGDARDRQVEIQSSKLALEERKILVEGERALLLLAEEGSSTAFPEAVQQLVTDLRSVVERLQKADVGKLTIGIEEEIVTALEEMIESLKQVQKKNEEKKQQKPQGNQPPPGDEQNQPLVDALAELRLIKTLQQRVNSRTDRLSKMLTDPNDPVGRVETEDLRKQVQELAGRQEKIQEVTRELVIKSSKKE